MKCNKAFLYYYLYFILLIVFYCGVSNALESNTTVNFKWMCGYSFPQTNIFQNFALFPGVRLGSSMCGTSDGKRIFLFGGGVIERSTSYFAEASSASADLWSLDTDSMKWTWHTGLLNRAAVFPLLGTTTPNATPGARLLAITWYYNNDVYLFGGIASNGYPSNDMWRYSTSENQWYWIDGNQSAPAISNTDHYPNAVRLPCYYITSSSVWLYGGGDYETASYTLGLTNNLWQLDKATLTWQKISNATAAPALQNAQMWVDDDYVTIYGGYNGSSVSYNFLRYSFSESKWIITNDGQSSYDANNCATNTCSPGPRMGANTWIDSTSGDLYLYGGGTDINTNGSKLSLIPKYNDLWKYSANRWYYISGALGDASQATTPFPIPVSLSSFYYDNSNSKAYSFSGRTDSTAQATAIQTMYTYNSTWNTASFISSSRISNFVDYPNSKNSSSLLVRPGSSRSAGINLVNNSLYYYGGCNGNYVNDFKAKKWKYDLTTGVWTLLAEVPDQNYPLMYEVTFVYNSKLYIFGGVAGGSLTPVSTLLVTDLDSSTFTQLGGSVGDVGGDTWPAARIGHVGWYYGTQLYVFGGVIALTDGGSMIANDLWAYSLQSNNWSKFPDSSTPGSRAYAASCTFGQYAYIFGGNDNVQNTSTIYQYDMVENTWTLLSNFSGPGNQPGTTKTGGPEYYPASRVGASMVYRKGSLFIYGGTSTGTSYYGDIWEFNLEQQMWFWHSAYTATLSYANLDYNATFPAYRGYTGYTPSNNGMYIFGGHSIIISAQASTSIGAYLDDLWNIELEPVNSKCGDGIIEGQEQCESGDCCDLSTCTFKNFATVCRNLNDTELCDAVDYCTGDNATCFNTYLAYGTACRSASGDCDSIDFCTGTSPVCIDSFKVHGTSCNESLCQTCNGSSPTCSNVSNCTSSTTSGSTSTTATTASTTTSTTASTTTGSTAICGNEIVEAEEQCDSSSVCCDSTTCQLKFNSTVCRAYSGGCDLVDYCNGVNDSCVDTSLVRDSCGICGGDGSTCKCTVNNGGCDQRVQCTYDNTTSRVKCGPCPTGFSGDGHTCTALCGDGYCNATLGETCVSCPKDCNSTYCGECGDSQCNANETCSTCYEDCGSCGVSGAQCASGCGHGVCENGKCVCDDQWSGPTCSTQTQPVDVVVNTTTPQIVVLDGSSGFNIGIKEINEETATGTIARTVLISEVNFTLVNSTSSGNTIYNYTANLENGALLNVIVWSFKTTTTMTFANITTTYAPNTLKLALKVQDWPFYSISNSLVIVLESNDKNSEACYNGDSDESGNLRWLMVVVNSVSLYGQFLEKAVIDGRIRQVNYTLNADNTVSALLPHFWDYADMDPNYSVLLDDTNVGDCADNSKNNKGVSKLVVAIVIPVVVGSILLVALAFYLKPKIQTKMALRKSESQIPAIQSQNDTEMSDIRIEKQQPMQVTTASGTFTVDM